MLWRCQKPPCLPHRYFDVWSPELATRYAEVWWHDMGKQALPKEIVARFANKTMAITGYEMDMVMVQPTGQPGAHPAQDVSVPINWAYNHHYETLSLSLSLSPTLTLTLTLARCPSTGRTTITTRRG